MNSRTIDVVTDWETVAASEGYEGLHQLADTEFSGAVSAGMTWAFYLNGRVIGVFEGDIEDFEDAELTAYRAADPSLPLLFAMQERGGETRARYYTNDTPLSDADQTLSNGGFTGYIELSENVLSGDYYVVYHGGKSMSAAFVGTSKRLVTGEDAFEQAADEVGIYEVIDADVDILELPALPEPPDDEAPTDDSTADDAGVDDERDAVTPRDASADDPSGDDAEATPDGEAAIAADADAPADAGAGGDPPSAAAADDESAPETDPEAADAASADPGPGVESPGQSPEGRESDPTDDPNATAAPTSTGAEADSVPESGGSGADPGDSDPAVGGERPVPDRSTAPVGDDGEDAGRTGTGVSRDRETADGPTEAEPSVFSDEERWREARSIPSLDPSESRTNGTATRSDDEDRRSARERVAQMQKQRSERKEARKRTQRASERARGSDADRSQPRATEGPDPAPQADADRVKKRLARARDRVEELETEREELIDERDALRSERAEYRERVDALEAERDELRAEVERLESELQSAAAASETEDVQTSMSPRQALSGTNLFVRYEKKGTGTLEHAHDGEAPREDVRENLRLEHHTTFESEGVAVDGQPYEAFLRESTEYAFANWVVTELLYEIGETGNRTGLGGVFDTIPEIDRIELDGTVGVDTDDGVEQCEFDVIFRDKMGDPLFVADLNASRNATTEAMVESLVQNTGTIAEADESLSAGFYVTESFYEPGALEAVAEETGGGLFARSKKLSYVKLSRKRGYHLCLVEARNGEFHLNVPDL
ncbi:DUF7527 domain-containing protein [Halobellus sp. GM3]|uniref:DUF7527 domain-containing protein n=1 Tax=Halobellus sp. GM3 TaxID=3458410 RepID=UPI00403DE60E